MVLSIPLEPTPQDKESQSNETRRQREFIDQGPFVFIDAGYSYALGHGNGYVYSHALYEQ